jgi:NADPH2:quinone reductase
MTTMRAAVMTAVGGPEVLELQQVALTWPRTGHDVLVRLQFAGLNPADTFFRALGTYIESDGPKVLGHDGAGVVEAVGPEVTGFASGDRVCFCNGGIGGEFGTYAEFSVVPEDQLVRVPDTVEMHVAAAFPLVAITAWEALMDRAALRADEFVLIHGGAGGTGQMAIQLARIKGAKIAATVSTAEKAEIVTALGADRAILYRSEDFVESALEWTNEEGVQVALDNVGPEVMARTFTAMAPYGRVVTLMGTPADDADLNAYNRNLTIHNVMMLTPMWLGLKDHLKRQADIVRNMIPCLANGQIKVRIQESLPLAQVSAAHKRLEAGGMNGKVVLDVRS